MTTTLDDDLDTNNCDRCGVELSGPWDDMCDSCNDAYGSVQL